MTVNWKNLIVYIPVFIIVVEVFDYFTNNYLSYFRAFILLSIIGLFFKHKNTIKIDVVFKTIISFLLYTLFISFFSSDLAYTFSSYLSIFTSMTFYLISYNYFTCMNDVKYLKPLFYIIPILFLLNLLIYSGLNIGEAVYGGALYFGQLHDNVIYVGSLIFLLSLVLNRYSNNRVRDNILMIILLIILILSLRRTAIILVLTGFIIYIIMSNKKKVLKNTLIIISVVVVAYPIYNEYLFEMVEAREQRVTLEAGLENETRIREMALISNRSFSFNDLQYSLFGMEYLNSYGTYSSDEFPVSSSRILHTDYSVVLHGSGLVGLTIYLLLLLFITIKSIKSVRYLGLKNNISIVLVILNVIIILVTMSGSILSIGFRTTYFILLGMFMRISRELINENYKYN